MSIYFNLNHRLLLELVPRWDPDDALVEYERLVFKRMP